jgi:hypothetical protein
MRRDVARAEMFRSVVEMLRHTLPNAPTGARRRRGMEVSGVSGEVYDKVVGLMIAAKWIARRRGRLHAT